MQSFQSAEVDVEGTFALALYPKNKEKVENASALGVELELMIYLLRRICYRGYNRSGDRDAE